MNFIGQINIDRLIEYWQMPVIQRIVVIIIGIVIIMAITSLLRRLIPNRIKDSSNKYRTRKFINFFGFFVVVIFIMMVYSSQLTGLTVIVGVAGAGIAFALQEVIVSIAGFIAISFSNFYKVGDRVNFGGIKGDVIDISMLRTSIMQIGDWVDGDLYNGKIVSVTNSFIFKEPVFNYSGDFPFLWDEVTIPLRSESDAVLAVEQFTAILNEVQGGYAIDAQDHWAKMTGKFMIENAQVKPMVTMSFDSNGMYFVLRYVVDYKKRRMTKDLIFTKALNAINSSNGKLDIAVSSYEVTNIK